MNCSPHDLRDYAFDELTAAERKSVEQHVRSCGDCADSLNQLRLTRTALLALPDAEPPQRIAFVSDPIFEPGPARRWWAAFWTSGARLGFASAAMLSAAIVFSAATRPQAPAAAPAVVTAAQVQSMVDAEVSRRLEVEVRNAVSASEAKQQSRTAELLAASERRHEMDREALRVAVDESFSVMRKQMNVMYVASRDLGASR